MKQALRMRSLDCQPLRAAHAMSVRAGFGEHAVAALVLILLVIAAAGKADAAPGSAAAARAALAAPPPSPSRLVVPIAVFGKDERRMLASGQRGLRDNIGVLEHRTTGSVCTAFCVAPDIIATAGHCVVGTASQPGSRPSLLRFRRDSARGGHASIAGADRGTSRASILTGADRLNTRPPINAPADWALLRLDRAACPAGGFKISQLSRQEITATAAQGGIYQVAYHRDLAHWKLAIATPCMLEGNEHGREWEGVSRDFEDADNLLLHTCDTESASSGSPLLIDGADGPEVVAINVGTYVRSRIIIHDGQVIQKLASEIVANTALLAAPLLPRIEALANNDIIIAREALARVQDRLAHKGFFVGLRDGIYGRITRTSIEAYEASMGLPVTGLATKTLLQRLQGSQPAQPERADHAGDGAHIATGDRP